MPEYIRSLVVILALASIIFIFGRSAATAAAMSNVDFVFRRNTWYMVVTAAFLSYNYWIFVPLLALILYLRSKSEVNNVAMYFFLLLAVPHLTQTMPGFGVFGSIVEVDYVRILSLMLLLPVFLNAWRLEKKNREKYTLIDSLLLIYVILNIVLEARYNSLSGLIRSSIYWFIDVIIPYYAISRYVRTVRIFNDVFMSFVVGGLIVSLIGIFEFLKSWLLYSSLNEALGLESISGYLDRGGMIRAMVSSGQPIIFGFVVAYAIPIYFYLRKLIPNKTIYFFGIFILFMGVIAPLSKGPWVGLFCSLIVVWLFLLEKKEKYTIISIIFLLSVGILFSGSLERVTSFIPFYGDQDEGSTTYRQLIFNKSMSVISDNFYFGSGDFADYMEDAKNGAGLLDLVNSYLVVCLYVGVVGLMLYLAIFASSLYKVILKIRSSKSDVEIVALGYTLISMVVCVTVTIGTVSSITHVPNIIWATIALCVGFLHIKSTK